MGGIRSSPEVNPASSGAETQLHEATGITNRILELRKINRPDMERQVGASLELNIGALSDLLASSPEVLQRFVQLHAESE